jgi:hypothetical protein
MVRRIERNRETDGSVMGFVMNDREEEGLKETEKKKVRCAEKRRRRERRKEN